MDTSPIRVSLRDERSKRFVGRVDDVWFGREGAQMSIVFGLREGPSLSLGRAAQVCFEGGPFEGEVQAAGLIVGRTESDHDRYQLRFGEAAYPTIGVLYETRSSPRVSPGQPITAALRSLDTGAKATAGELVDLSEGGLALSLPLIQERSLATFGRVRVALPLPGLAEPLVFDGEIRHRTLQDNRVVYGVQFDPGRDNDPRFQKLRGFVEARLDEMRSSGDKNPVEDA